MLSRRGARIVHGATMATMPLGDLDATIAATRRVMSGPVDTVVFTTGIGVRSWFAAAERTVSTRSCAWRWPGSRRRPRSEGRTCGPVRGPRDRLDDPERDERRGVRPARRRRRRRPAAGRAARWRTTTVRRCHAGPRTGRDHRRAHLRVAPARRASRRRSGCSRRRRPVSSTPSRSRVPTPCTTRSSWAPTPAGLIAAFDDGVVAAAVGPVTAQALRSHGVDRVLEPAACSARLDGPRRSSANWRAGPGSWISGVCWRRWQGTALIDPDGAEVELTRGESRLLTRLAARAPTVVPKVALVEHGSDEHAAEAAIARLRAKLGPLARASGPCAAAATPARCRSPPTSRRPTSS